jgi:multiple sugar transport system ATP-binding protein
MVQVQLEDLAKRFGDTVAVDSINLTIESGELVVLLGPSGCGKTTTLRMVAGLEEVTSGRILIGDREVEHIPGRDRNVAMVFQSYALYPHMSVKENMSFALRLRKTPPESIERQVRAVAAILGIEDLLSRRPKNLSGGQQQRVALGRAMVRNPDVFLFDEPLSNLDAKLRATMRTEIVKLHHRLDATMIYVTHDQTEAMTMADRIVVMNFGRIQQVGTPLHIYDDPQNVFVAGFIGAPAMNIFRGDIDGDGENIRVRAAELTLTLPVTHPARTLHTAEFGIRPEFLTIDAQKANGGALAEISTIEHLGSETIFRLKTGGPDLTAKTKRDDSLSSGDVVTIRAEPDKVLVFDAETGLRHSV